MFYLIYTRFQNFSYYSKFNLVAEVKKRLCGVICACLKTFLRATLSSDGNREKPVLMIIVGRFDSG